MVQTKRAGATGTEQINSNVVATFCFVIHLQNTQPTNDLRYWISRRIQALTNVFDGIKKGNTFYLWKQLRINKRYQNSDEWMEEILQWRRNEAHEWIIEKDRSRVRVASFWEVGFKKWSQVKISQVETYKTSYKNMRWMISISK